MITIPYAFKEVLDTDKNQILIYGGRLGGKSSNTAIISVLKLIRAGEPRDVIVARASYGSLADSSYEEFTQAIISMGLEGEFSFAKSPLRIEYTRNRKNRQNPGSTIYFVGYGGSNMSRTKSIKTKHPIICIIFEETQELKEKRNLDEALASFRRNYGSDVKQIVMGNPPPQDAHWFNVLIAHKKFDQDWLVKRVTWMDILDFINDFDLREILKTKIEDEAYYNWFYMGESGAGLTGVYPMFRESKHMITGLQFDRLRNKYPLRIVACMIGGDGAVNRDATSFVPLMLLNNGQAVVGPIFYHNPKEDGVLGYHQLVQDHLSRWVEELCIRYGMVSPKEWRTGQAHLQPIPMFMRIDSAAPDLIRECKYFFGDRIDVGPVQKKGVMEMVGIVQSAISNDNVTVLEYGGYFSYVKNLWIKTEKNILADQIEMLMWNEKQNGYDPIIPNDVCDAFTYGTISWYGNQENIQYFNVLKTRNIPNMLIRDILTNE